MTNRPPLAAGRRFGGYEIQEHFGRLGGADLYRAKQLNLGRLVTLTVLPPEEGAKAALRLRFERQATAASKLSHPNIVSALDAGTIAGHAYIVSEHVGGRRLSDLLDAGEWIGTRRAVSIALGMARALAHMDAAGMLHRHVTPECILLGEAGIPKLRGFSFSRPHRDTSGETWFDPDDQATVYAAPDGLDQKTLDVRADIYSLGCVLFHMLAGHPPFRGSTAASILELHAKAPVPDIHTLREGLDPSIGYVIAKALEKQRDRRYPTPAAMLADLEAIEAGRPVDPPASDSGSGIRSFLRRRPR
jgi:serine/threonine-protein kinase